MIGSNNAFHCIAPQGAPKGGDVPDVWKWNMSCFRVKSLFWGCHNALRFIYEAQASHQRKGKNYSGMRYTL